jgi:hypothetical protein
MSGKADLGPTDLARRLTNEDFRQRMQPTNFDQSTDPLFGRNVRGAGHTMDVSAHSGRALVTQLTAPSAPAQPVPVCD